MGELESLLSTLRPDIESQLQPHLHGIVGHMIRRYLPQVWVFRTESDSASLRVSEEGNVRASSGVPRQYDVLVDWTQEQLTAALKTRDRAKIPAGAAPTFEFKTHRGKTAFSFLRSRFGL
jgi:hypothetical protein